jgi:hypothetical protein
MNKNFAGIKMLIFKLPANLYPGFSFNFLAISVFSAKFGSKSCGQVAQSVEQRTENPCVGGSIPPLPIASYKTENSPGNLGQNRPWQG